MFWILRRTRLNSAVAFFNAINNNANNNSSTEMRPARKDYSKLAAEEPSSVVPSTMERNGNEEDPTVDTRHTADLIDTDTDSSCTDMDYDGHEYTDDSDYDESLTCNVCDRSFPCHRQLASHKQKKRHFGCSACDSLFPSLMALEHHKEEFEHWSGDEDICTDSDEDTSELTVASEECERLL